MADGKSSITNRKNTIVFLVGPTAIGKSETAIILAKKINAEIISCDSMQIYKDMDIITSKPRPAFKKRVLHHLIDIVSPTDEYNVAKYRKDAVKKIKEIIKRNKISLFVGGTGLYVSIVIDGIFNARPENMIIRQRLYKEAKDLGSIHLYKRLKTIDPEAASKIHPHDTRRIIRALEVYESTGKPISFLQKQRKGLSDEYDIKIFGFNMERNQLYKRIDERVDKMFSQGLVNEVKRLLKLKLSKTASSVIGIKELKGYFDGLHGLEEAKHLIKRNTRRYAKRQLTWFRKDKRIHWINVKDKETPKEIAQKIWRKLS